MSRKPDFILFVTPMFIFQRPRFPEKLVYHPMVNKCWATVSDAARTLNHDWLNVSCLLAWFYFTPDRGPLSAELYQPWTSLRHGLYVILLPYGQFSGLYVFLVTCVH